MPHPTSSSLRRSAAEVPLTVPVVERGAADWQMTGNLATGRSLTGRSQSGRSLTKRRS